MEKQRKPRKETFLKKYVHYEHDDFFFLATDVLLTEITDKQLIEKLKAIFLLAAEDHNDKAALKSLELLAKAYDRTNRSEKQLHDYLMIEAYWQLPDMKRISTGHRFDDDKFQPSMLKTKSWILEQVIRDWHVDHLSKKITKGSIKIFQFLIAAYEPLPEDWKTLVKNAEFKMKSKGRRVSKDEKGEILGLIRKHDDRFRPKELEEWMKQPWIPNEFEKTLAIARTREGGPDLWRNDIRNAELVKPFSPDERTKAAIDLYKRYGDIIAGIDQKVQKLPEQMRTGTDSWSRREEIGASEYVLGKTELIYHDLFEIIINIVMEPEYSEALVQDNFTRAEVHIQQWLSQNCSQKVILNMSGGETGLKLNMELYGDRYKG